MKNILGYKFYTNQEIAAMFGIRAADVANLIKSGELQAFYHGKRAMVSEYAIKKYLSIHSIWMTEHQRFYEINYKIELLRTRLDEINNYIKVEN